MTEWGGGADRQATGDEDAMLGVYLPDGSDGTAVAAALAPWFGETRFVPRTHVLDAHLVAWAPRRELSTRVRARIALAVYAAGATEAVLFTPAADLVLPRLMLTAS